MEFLDEKWHDCPAIKTCKRTIRCCDCQIYADFQNEIEKTYSEIMYE